MYDLIAELYPICRSITGNGVRKTLDIIGKHVPLEIHEVPTGTNVFDWTIPKEWNISDAYIKNSKGEIIVDFKKSNLHILNYSSPVHKKLSLKELQEHIFTLPNQVDVIPYLTTYYKENWGFCMQYNQYKKLPDDEYEVFINSSLKNGSLTYGEFFIKGKTDDEILFTSYVCHPSLCNDNLSGVVLITYLAKLLKNLNLKYSYRFLFIPETIGAITWLSKNVSNLSKIKCGLVATCVGDPGAFTYKKTRNNTSKIDRIVEKVLLDSKVPHKIVNFFPSGSDERQFSSPGFDLHIGSLMRTMYTVFPEYHTSADNLDFVTADSMRESLEQYLKVIFILENDAKYANLVSKCEPQLGKRGLYDAVGGQKKQKIEKMALLWVLNLSDGGNSLLDISIRSGLTFEEIKNAADLLYEKKLLKIID